MQRKIIIRYQLVAFLKLLSHACVRAYVGLIEADTHTELYEVIKHGIRNTVGRLAIDIKKAEDVLNSSGRRVQRSV